MKKIVTLLFFLSLFSSNICFSQSGWFWSFPYPTGNHLYSVAQLDSITAFAVGRYGTLLKTTNGGQNWLNQLYFSTNQLNAVQFVDRNTGFVSGIEWTSHSSGVLYMTTNCGVSWTHVVVAEYYEIMCMHFLDVNTGYVGGVGLGGSILKTTNGGYNWTVLSIGYNVKINSLYIADSLNLYIAVENGIYKSSNAGANWTLVSSINGIYLSLSFLNSMTGYACGYQYSYPSFLPLLIKTINGGLNWINLYPVLPSGSILNSIIFQNANTGFACGSNGVIIKSTNAGSNWYTQYQSNNLSIYGLHLVDSLHGMAIGSNGFILKTTNGGGSWLNNMIPNYWGIGYGISRIRFFNRYVGYATIGNKVMKTTNEGLDWFILNTPTSFTLYAISVVDSNIVYVAGGSPSSPNEVLLKSTNGGLNWISQNSQLTYGIVAMSFVNASVGFCMSWNNVSKTTDGGFNWAICGAVGGHSIFFVDGETGYISGFTNAYKSTDGGFNWMQISTNGESIFFLNANTGFTAGIQMCIRKTTNGGLNWITQTQSSDTWRFYDIHFFDSLIGYAVGENAKIAKTTNGGLNWNFQLSPTDNHFLSVFAIDTNLCYVAGLNNIILKTTNGGIPIAVKNTKELIPQSFSLSQNYPNPFNPVTRIKYDIPPSKGARGMMTQLIIYDILGREIETLVNESKKPGSYEVTWDASSYASGVYFYRLMTDNYSETKKMVLIK